MDDTLPPKNLTFDILTFSSTLSINYGRIIVWLLGLFIDVLILASILFTEIPALHVYPNSLNIWERISLIRLLANINPISRVV